MSFDLDLKLAVYRHFADTGDAPTPRQLASQLGVVEDDVVAGFGRLRVARVLYLEAGGRRIRMAPPFSAAETQHFVESADRRYFANCAWDALGIPAALQQSCSVRSRCEQTLEPLSLEVGADGPPPSDWLFHCLVPAAHWWDDLVFT